MSQEAQRKSSAPGNHRQQQQQQPLTSLLGNLLTFQRSGKSHSTSCVPAAQSPPSRQSEPDSSSQLPLPQQPRLPSTPPTVLVSSSDREEAPMGGNQRQATFRFPSGVCSDDELEGDEDNEAEDDGAEEDEEGSSFDRESEGACCAGGAAASNSSAASLTVGGDRQHNRSGGRPDIQRCHSDSGSEASAAHALFLRQRGKSQKTIDDADIRPREEIDRVYDGEDANSSACRSPGHQRRQQQPQQQHHLHHHQHQQYRLRLGFGASGGGAERKEKTKKKSIGDKFSFLSRKSVEANSADKASGIKPSSDQVQRWGASFDSLLNDKYGLALFRAFLKTEYSDENIEFWIACEEYRALVGPKKQTVKAQKIYNEFVAFQAPREVNLDSTTRLTTINAMGSPDGHLFEQAQKRIQALMEKDSYQRFLRSEVYQNHLKDAGKGSAGSSSFTSLGGH